MKCRPILSDVKKEPKTAPTKLCLKKKEKHLTLEGKTCFLWETGSKRSKTRNVVFFKPNELSDSHAWLPIQNSPFFNDNAASGLSIWWQSTTSRGLLQFSGKEKTNKSPSLHYSKPAHSPCLSFIFFFLRRKVMIHPWLENRLKDAPRSTTYRECFHSKRYVR